MMSEKTVKADTIADSIGEVRPTGLTFSSVCLGLTGVYYLAYPLVVQDPTVLPVYVLGVLSLVASYGVLKVMRWGLWIGMLLFPVQIIAPAFALQVVLPRFGQTVEVTGFAASLAVLILLATLSFILLLDKRKSFR